MQSAAPTEVHAFVSSVPRQRAPRHIRLRQRRLHKAFLRYHDPNNWPVLREALRRMGRADLIGNGKQQLIPGYQPAGTGDQQEGRRGGSVHWTYSNWSD